jgi:hypothetical protein
MSKLTLTFDHGPTPGMTERVLDVLGERDVHATFFPTGSVTVRRGWPGTGPRCGSRRCVPAAAAEPRCGLPGCPVSEPAAPVGDGGLPSGTPGLGLSSWPVLRSAVKNSAPCGVGAMVPGEHANVAAAVLQPRDDKLPEAAGTASDKDGRGHGSPFVAVRPRPLSHRRGLDGHVYDRQQVENVTDERT